MVRDSEPSVPEDHEWQEQNWLFAKGQKQKKDATKKKCNEDIRVREALEKRHQQQARDGLPREESSSEPESDGDDFMFFQTRRRRCGALVARCPHKGLLPGGEASGELSAPEREGEGLAPWPWRDDGAAGDLFLDAKA
jgi:hypothetical protein